MEEQTIDRLRFEERPIRDKIGFTAQAQSIFTVGFFELYFASHRKKWDAENLERAHHIIAL